MVVVQYGHTFLPIFIKIFTDHHKLVDILPGTEDIGVNGKSQFKEITPRIN